MWITCPPGDRSPGLSRKFTRHLARMKIASSTQDSGDHRTAGFWNVCRCALYALDDNKLWQIIIMDLMVRHGFWRLPLALRGSGAVSPD